MISSNNSISILIRLCLICLIASWAIPVHADQDDPKPQPLRTRISLECFQGSKEPVKIVAKLRYRENKVYKNLVDAEIIFNSEIETVSHEVARIKTDENGESILHLDIFDNILIDQDSLYTITATFAGMEGYKDSDRSLQFKRATIDVSITSEDSIKVFSVNTYELNQDQTPIGEQDVYVMVPRMFGNLTVLNEFSDEDGQLEINFPNDIPADLNDSLDIIIQIPETDLYGTLETRISTDWGLPRESNTLAQNQLWSPDAPLWMLITFFILMVLVWGHFFVIIFKLYQIRKEGLNL